MSQQVRNSGFVLIGGIERVLGECFLVEVQQRDANTLLPLIAQYIRPGSIVKLFTGTNGAHTTNYQPVPG